MRAETFANGVGSSLVTKIVVFATRRAVPLKRSKDGIPPVSAPTTSGSTSSRFGSLSPVSISSYISSSMTTVRVGSSAVVVGMIGGTVGGGQTTTGGQTITG